MVRGDGVGGRADEVRVRRLEFVGARQGGRVDCEAGAVLFGVGGVLAAGAAAVEDGYFWRENCQLRL